MVGWADLALGRGLLGSGGSVVGLVHCRKEWTVGAQ